MLSKQKLREDFSKNPEEYYRVELFNREGFSRHTCRLCGKNFWSIRDRDVCEDSSHSEYTFFKDKPKGIGYVEFWKKFADFFKKNGHTEVKSYPVVSRWRQDLYFTIASIQDFQRIENGKMSFEYGANPLVVPQICIRFGDTDNVGVTGRHFTSFMMAGHHAFNYPKEGYWRDRTIELNYELLTSVIGVKKEDLVYNEDVWAMPDFSEFGPSLESYANGLELVNSVFTQFEYANGGVKELEGRVVDVGWGLDSRILWFYTGYDTAYEAVFDSTIRRLKPRLGIEIETDLFKRFAKVSGALDIDEVKNVREKEQQLMKAAGITLGDYENKIKPTQAFYAILDHARTLLFGISDGSLPSNIGGGYNLRIILRRSLDFIEKYKLGIDLNDIAELQADELHALYPQLRECLDNGDFASVMDTEVRRYSKSKENAGRIVDGIISRGERIDSKRLATLYESNGITPDFIKAVAAEKGFGIELPENVYENIVKGDIAERKKQPKLMEEIQTGDMPKTVKLFYTSRTENVNADAKVLRLKGSMAVLDRTPFYAESGGQEADRGGLGNVTVKDVQSVDGVIVHMFDGKPDFKEGDTVHCSVDTERRTRLMAHHTATHLMSAAARQVLGQHAWQEGAKKSADKAHIDIAHYEKLSGEQVRTIEDTANGYIVHGIRVKIEYVPRSEAESRFGFSIYQGHGVPASELRMVEIYDTEGRLIDAEACGGLHLAGCESMIGIIKVIASSRIHDGINRLEYVAGPAVVDYMRKLDGDISSLASAAGVDQDKLTQSITSQIKELQEYRKEHERLTEKLGGYIAAELLSKGDRITENLNYDRKALRGIATKAADSRKGVVVLLYNNDGYAVCVSSDGKTGALEFAKDSVPKIVNGSQFIGGGSARMAEGRISAAK